MSNRKDYVTAQEIDGMTGIKSPHARELEDLARNKTALFLNHKKRRIKIITETQLRGKFGNLGFDEDYTLTIEFFPEVKAHILFYNYEEEEFGGAQLKFLFSGDRVKWVPTEDTISLLDATFEYLENLLAPRPEIHELLTDKTDLLKLSIKQRKAPFAYLREQQLSALSEFIGGEIKFDEDQALVSKIYFEGVTVVLTYDTNSKSIDLNYEGENLKKINNYARDQLGIFLINHCLRFISVTNPTMEMPKIMRQMFSFSYIKTHLNDEK